MIWLGLRRFAPFSLPPRAITTKTKAAFSCAEALFFHEHSPAQERALGEAVHTKKALNIVERFRFGRDSVGIRTQDPQLRRLLLYPTELPNRSLFSFGFRGLMSKVAAKLMIIFGFAILKLIFRILFGRDLAGEGGGEWV